MDSLMSLPNELLIEIILKCNYKNIYKLKQVNNNFYHLINENNLIKRRCNVGYPRIEKKAKVHTIDDKISRLGESGYDENSDWLVSDDVIMRALTDLINNEADIVNGDIIVFDPSECGMTGPAPTPVRYFKDGNIIMAEYDPRALPDDFHVIENGTPLDYWNFEYKDIYSIYKKNIWFDHKLVRQQCIDNIKIHTKYKTISTSFIYNDIEYTIICVKKYEDGWRYCFEKFNILPILEDDTLKYVLAKDELIEFSYDVLRNIDNDKLLVIEVQNF